MLSIRYDVVYIPKEVLREVGVKHRGRYRINALMKRYSFIKRCAIAEPIRVSLLCDPRSPASARIDPGEAEAIIQANERSAVDVLIDERRARRIAEGHSLNVCGLLGLLKDFKRNALITAVGPLIAKLKDDLDYRIRSDLLIRELAELGEVWTGK
jgi:predicted nucleic acid-binding protein